MTIKSENKIEIGRELISEGQVEVMYSDGSSEVIDSPKPLPPQDLQIDEITPESEGHVFTNEQIAQAEEVKEEI